MRIDNSYLNINMYSRNIDFENIRLKVDSIDSKKKDDVMAIFYEEQPLTWLLYKDEITKTHQTLQASIDFLDVGSGSGFWAILCAKYFGGNVLAIDKNPRAVKFTEMNSLENNVKIVAKEEIYDSRTAPLKDAKIIVLNPPHHIYPQEIEEMIPLYARGGWNGQEEFKNQLKVANHHLTQDGILVFIMMCLGRENLPEYIRYVYNFIDKDKSLYYINIFEPTKTRDFLSKVYIDKYQDFVNDVSYKFPQLFFTNGIIRNDGKGVIRELKPSLNLFGRTWNDRIMLHKEINSFLYSKF